MYFDNRGWRDSDVNRDQQEKEARSGTMRSRMESTREEGAWIDGRGEQGGGVGDGPKRALGTFGDNGEPWGLEQPRIGPHRHVHEEASKSSMRRPSKQFTLQQKGQARKRKQPHLWIEGCGGHADRAVKLRR